jgi:hypothetical protein
MAMLNNQRVLEPKVCCQHQMQMIRVHAVKVLDGAKSKLDSSCRGGIITRKDCREVEATDQVDC